MAMMMTGRVLLVCALCVLWCGAGGRCDGDADFAEIKDEPSKASQSSSQGGHAGEKHMPNPIVGVVNTSNELLNEQDGKNGSPQTGSVEQPSTDNDGMEAEGEKAKGKKVEDAEPRRNGKEQSQDDSERTEEREALIEEERNTSPPTVANKLVTSEEGAGPAAGNAGPRVQAVKPPQLPASPQASDETQSGDSSVGGPKKDKGSNLNNSASDSGNPSPVDSLFSGGGSSGLGGGSPQDDSSDSPLSAAVLSLSSPLGTPSVQDTQPSEKVRQSETISSETAFPNEQPKERSESEAKEGTFTSQEAAESPYGDGDATENEKEKRDVGLKSTTSPTPTTSDPPVKQTTPRASSAEPSPTTEVQAEEETLKDNVTTAMRNDTAIPGDSDGSTAVSHTTSPLLLLLFLVACAAAAAVVAA
ncbi:Mucin-associated surface protein (MASP) [Trypanosoma cruzi]|uniref:Mucin-associated surface protein (MASP), putative n=2 Tax=Trypanosoma cruzi TaxID=5693 RepID=Q4E1I2_TRYCC|nr:mucin-associated surface protein (MASP), putative [Trypanosoma cruzi]EAN98635.1 mucin-associated surface protein (MASP), putative [Trypanosoma cruzi]KAF8292004.1 Mucin-associated surface protein (MASP), subgroup S008 [Trypanosoma cruzi]PWV17044.1 Mucin-associated surface protein (MASP) [Trypanosoma cruzi]|eukprot:XP_820486.1 mucin-associated surface protein (MASP) [Trypanosoma cruzi strain CL Brener]